MMMQTVAKWLFLTLKNIFQKMLCKPAFLLNFSYNKDVTPQWAQRN